MNYIFFNPDEMRADALGCYGEKSSNTPNIDAFAKNGVLFEQCHIQHPVCTPSRCSFMTGLYPHVNGHRTLWNLIEYDEPHLFQYLKNEGFEVAWWGKNDLLTKDAIYNSVDYVNLLSDEVKNLNPQPFQSVINRNKDKDDYYSFLYDTTLEDITSLGDYRSTKSACDYLISKKDSNKPFAMFLALGNPHPPYHVPKTFLDKIDPKNIRDLFEKELSNKPQYFSLIKKYRNLNNVPDETLKEIYATYLSMCSVIDYLFGMIIEALEASNHLDDTTVMFFSDHGDFAGDYGLVEKWPNALEDAITRVPLIVNGPTCKKGHRVKEQVELFDIMATTLDYENITAKHTHFAKSLRPMLEGANADPSRLVFCEGGYDTHEPQCFEYATRNIKGEVIDKDTIYYPKFLQQEEHPKSVCRTVMVRSLTHKLIFREHDICELYDLVNDPKELNNVYTNKEYIEVKSTLERALLEFYLHTSDTVPFKRDPRGFLEYHEMATYIPK